jgi:hypothetical protein
MFNFESMLLKYVILLQLHLEMICNYIQYALRKWAIIILTA